MTAVSYLTSGSSGFEKWKLQVVWPDHQTVNWSFLSSFPEKKSWINNTGFISEVEVLWHTTDLSVRFSGHHTTSAPVHLLCSSRTYTFLFPCPTYNCISLSPSHTCRTKITDLKKKKKVPQTSTICTPHICKTNQWSLNWGGGVRCGVILQVLGAGGSPEQILNRYCHPDTIMVSTPTLNAHKTSCGTCFSSSIVAFANSTAFTSFCFMLFANLSKPSWTLKKKKLKQHHHELIVKQMNWEEQGLCVVLSTCWLNCLGKFNLGH